MLGGIYVLHFFCAGTYLALAAYIVARNARSRLNWTCAAINLCFAHWSGALGVSHYPGASKETAALFYSIGSFGWGSVASVACLFIAAFLRPVLLGSRAFLALLFTPSVLTIYAQWSGRLARDYPKVPWGYTYVWQDSGWAYFFFAYYMLYMTAGLLVMLCGARYMRNALHAQQARILGASAILPFTLSSLTDVILPELGLTVVPDMAPDFALVWAIGLVFAIAQYRMLELSPAAAADVIVSSMSDGLLLVDRAGWVVRTNAAASSLLGRSEAELCSRRLAELLPPRLRAMEPCADQREELELLRSDGSEVRVLFSASPIVTSTGERLGCVCVATDISELKRAEQKLRAAHDELEHRVSERTSELSTTNAKLEHEVAQRRNSEERFRLLINTMQEGVWVVDVHARTTFTNVRLAELLEYPEHELMGRHPGDFADEHARSVIEQTLARAEREETREADWALCSKSGKRLNAIVQIASLSEHGRYAGAVLTVQDVTERSRLQTQLAQADRLASLGVLAAGVGHEINNPLTYVLSSLHELDERLAAPPAADPGNERAELLTYIREALHGAQRVRDIVGGLRNFTRVDERRLVPVDVHRAIDSALSMVGNDIRFRARLVKEYAELPCVLGNLSQLSQVFLNLLVNAAHAITKGGVEDNEISIRTSRDDLRVLVEVRDTGHGIAPDALGKLFDPFFTTKDVGQGSGLGLWICHKTILSHAGAIEVQSQPGGGTTFRVSLPALRGSAAREFAAGQAGAEEQLPRGRILVIDDEPLLRRAFERALKQHHDLVLAESAECAQEILQRDEAFDVILCDLMMPGMSGMDWFAWLSTYDRELAERVVFVTGGAVTQQAREFVERVPNVIVAKPFEPRDIRAVVLKTRLAQQRRALRAG